MTPFALFKNNKVITVIRVDLKDQITVDQREYQITTIITVDQTTAINQKDPTTVIIGKKQFKS